MRTAVLIVAILLAPLTGCHWIEHIINGHPMTRQEKADLYQSQLQTHPNP